MNNINGFIANIKPEEVVDREDYINTVSYTHLTLPTNSLV